MGLLGYLAFLLLFNFLGYHAFSYIMRRFFGVLVDYRFWVFGAVIGALPGIIARL